MVVRCKPLSKDHLPLKTAFPGPKGWSLVTGFTVLVGLISNTTYSTLPLLQYYTSVAPYEGEFPETVCTEQEVVLSCRVT